MDQKKTTSGIVKVKNPGQCIGCYSCMLACASVVHQNLSLNQSAILVKTSGGYPGRLVINICRGCTEPPCLEACSYDAIIPRSGGGIHFKRDKCTGCKKCVSSCLIGAIQYDHAQKTIIPCIQCGICTQWCPHHVLEMEEIK